MLHTHSSFSVVYNALYSRYQSSFISVEQAADEFSIHFTTARSWLSKGSFPVETLTLGSRRVVPLAGIANFIVRESGLVDPEPEQVQLPDAAAEHNGQVLSDNKRSPGRPRKIQLAEAKASEGAERRRGRKPLGRLGGGNHG